MRNKPAVLPAHPRRNSNPTSPSSSVPHAFLSSPRAAAPPRSCVSHSSPPPPPPPPLAAWLAHLPARHPCLLAGVTQWLDDGGEPSRSHTASPWAPSRWDPATTAPHSHPAKPHQGATVPSHGHRRPAFGAKGPTHRDLLISIDPALEPVEAGEGKGVRLRRCGAGVQASEAPPPQSPRESFPAEGPKLYCCEITPRKEGDLTLLPISTLQPHTQNGISVSPETPHENDRHYFGKGKGFLFSYHRSSCQEHSHPE